MTDHDQQPRPTLGEEISTIKTDVCWIKWGMTALASAMFTPKVGGPNLPHAVLMFLGHL